MVFLTFLISESPYKQNEEAEAARAHVKNVENVAKYTYILFWNNFGT